MRLGAIPENALERILLALGVVPTPMVDLMATALLSRSLMAATQLGVFEQLREGARTPEELAERINTDPRATAKLLNGLMSAGYLRLKGERYALAPVARKWLLSDSAHSLRDFALFMYENWELLSSLEDIVRDGKASDIHRENTPEQWSAYQRGMRSLAGLSAEEVARRIPTPRDPRAMLDLGGSHGYFSVCLCRRYPQLRSTILDLPEAVEHAAPILAAEGMGDRVVHRVGDALTDDLGEGSWDLVFLGNLAHLFDEKDNEKLTERVARALRPGGVFAVFEPVRPAPGQVGQIGALTDLFFALASPGGTYSVDEIAAWQAAAGLQPRKPIRLRTAPGLVIQAAIK